MLPKLPILHIHTLVSRAHPGVHVRVCPRGTRDTKSVEINNKVPKF